MNIIWMHCESEGSEEMTIDEVTEIVYLINNHNFIKTGIFSLHGSVIGNIALYN